MAPFHSGVWTVFFPIAYELSKISESDNEQLTLKSANGIKLSKIGSLSFYPAQTFFLFYSNKIYYLFCTFYKISSLNFYPAENEI